MSFISRLKVRFGMIPSTDHVVSQRQALEEEYDRFINFTETEAYKRYKELDEFVNSPEFEQQKEKIKGQKFEDTEAFQKLQRYKELKKDPAIKTYEKVIASKAFSDYQATEKSSQLSRFLELKEYINSSDFQNIKNNTPKKEYKTTEAFQKEQEYIKLGKSPAIKKYIKFTNSSKFETYQSIKDSDKLTELKELEDYVQSEEFRQTKEYMALSPKKKFEQSDEYKQLQEYLQLKNSDDFKWFFSLEGTHKFDEIKRWHETFSDDFSQNQLDTNKWLTKYFYGEAILNDTYTIQTDKHFVTDGQNIEIENGILKIITKNEPVEGRAWHPKHGFHPKKFDYTSGIINTGHVLRQQYGKFEAKVKIDPGVGHAFWMAGDKALPQLNVFQYHKNKLSFGILTGSMTKKGVHKNISKTSGSKYTKDYHIFTLEWTPDKITWKINEQEAKTITADVPQIPMYINLSSGVHDGHVKDELLPATMEVEWVKVYERVDV